MAARRGRAHGGPCMGALEVTGRSAVRAPILRDRRAGVLLHCSSLDGPDGIGDLGPNAHRFLEWLAECGFRAWQMLPIGPVGPGNSPYSAESSFAGEPMFVSLDAVVDDGWLTRAELRAARQDRQPRRSTSPSTRRRDDSGVAWTQVRRFKQALLGRAYERFLARGAARGSEYRRFVRDSAWLPQWCAFVQRRGGSPGEAAFVQFLFDRQWRALRAASAACGVQLIGDLPIFVAFESADVQGHPQLFRLDARGRPTVVTGVPPDDFAATGQRWGHPHYRWPAHRRDGFAWWRSRVRAAVERFDLLRIDHFIGFIRAYEVPAHHRTAAHGRWRPTPGRELLRAIERDIGSLPFIAEDLGAVTRPVIALRDDHGLPGMKIVQNAFWSDDSGDRPHHHSPNTVAYPGTHDNDTVRGWWATLAPEARRRFLDYSGSAARDIVAAMTRLVMTSPAQLAIIPMQDLLGLGSQARMNLPGRGRGQWRWQLASDWRRGIDKVALRRMIAVAGRAARER